MNNKEKFYNKKLCLSFLNNNKNNSPQISLLNNKIFQNKKLNSLQPIKKIIPKNYSFNEYKDIKNINKNFNNLFIFNKNNLSIDLKNKKELPNLSYSIINIKNRKSFSFNKSNENYKNNNNNNYNYNNLYLNLNNSFNSNNNNEHNFSNLSINKSTNEINNEKEINFDENSLKKLNLIKKLIKELKEKNNIYINNELYKIFRDNVINIETKSTSTTNNYSDNDYINNIIKSNNTIKSNKTYNIENNINNYKYKINKINFKSSFLNIKKINKRIKLFKYDNKYNNIFSTNLTPLMNKSKLKLDLDYENDLNLDSFRFFKKYPCQKTNLYYYEPNKKYLVKNKTYNNIPLLDLNYVNKNQHQNIDKFNEMIFNIQNQLDNDINDIIFETGLNNDKNNKVKKKIIFENINQNKL